MRKRSVHRFASLLVALSGLCGCTWIKEQQREALLTEVQAQRDKVFSKIRLAQLKLPIPHQPRASNLQLALSAKRAHVDNTNWARAFLNKHPVDNPRAILLAHHDLPLTPSAKNSYLAQALFEALSAHRKQRSALVRIRGEALDDRLEVRVDAQLPYAALVTALYTAGQAQFGTFLFPVRSAQREVMLEVSTPKYRTQAPSAARRCARLTLMIDNGPAGPQVGVLLRSGPASKPLVLLGVFTKTPGLEPKNEPKERCSIEMHERFGSIEAMESALSSNTLARCAAPLITASKAVPWVSVARVMAALNRARFPSPALSASNDTTLARWMNAQPRCAEQTNEFSQKRHSAE